MSQATKLQADRGLDPLAGHQIYHAFTSANLDVSSALSHAARGHRQLDLLAHALGIDVSGYGKNHPMPGPNFTGADATDRAVAC